MQSSKLTPMQWSLTFCTIVLLSLVAIRCLVPVSPNLYWDSNPAQAAATSVSQIGAVGDSANATVAKLSFDIGQAAWLDILSVVAAGFALLFHVRAGGRIHRLSFALIAVGIPFCVNQMPTHIESLYKCGSWIGAVSIAIAALHLAQRPEQRRWFIAVMIALVFPMATDAVSYVFSDHPTMLEMFAEKEADWLKARGWAEGSPQHLQYRRRLEFNDATGAFSFSNVLGSITAAFGILALVASIGIALGRKRIVKGWVKFVKPGVPALFGLAAFFTVFLTHSKGAAVAIVMVAVLILLVLFARKHTFLRHWIAPAAYGLITIAVLVIVVRGMAGPPDSSEGERSLLFRWHYWQAAASMATEDAETLIKGVPPGGFQLRYAAAKNPINPEEVSSAHNVFIDQITMLGIGGWAWSILMLTWLWRSARHVSRELEDEQHDFDRANASTIREDADQEETASAMLQVDERDLLIAALLTLLVMGGQLFMRWEGMEAVRFLIWSIGMIAFLFGAATLASPKWLNRSWANIGMVLAAALLLIHNQIEMTFHQPGSAPIAWLMLAVAAAPSLVTTRVTKGEADAHGAPESPPVEPKHWANYIPAIVCLVAAIPMARLYAYPLAAEQHALAVADRNMRQSQLSIPTIQQAIEDLGIAERALPIDPRTYEWQVRLRLDLAGMTYVQVRRELPARQRDAMFKFVRSQLGEALATLDRADKVGLVDGKLLRLRAETHRVAGSMSNVPGTTEKAFSKSIEVWQRIVALKPFSWQDRMELADLLWKTNRRDEAAEQYKICLKLSDDAYLDEARQMSVALIGHAKARLKH